MFENYLKVALRNLWKNRVYSSINIFGLAMGLATCLLIFLYIIDEYSYDRYNKLHERIYRINADIKFGGGTLHLAVAPDPLGATLKKDYPQVENYTRVYASSGSKLIKKGNEFITEEAVAHVDSTFFGVFTLPSISGNTNTALNEPNTVVITKTAAKRYFGDIDPVGKIVEADATPYKVTALIEDVPENSHFHFDFFFSMDNVDYRWGDFLSNNFQTYIVLKEGSDYKDFEKHLKQVVDKYLLPQARQFMQISSMEEFEKAGNKLVYSLMPLTSIHLYSDRMPELGSNSSIQYVYIFGAVAIFVLLIACINFMNLATASSAGRAKEVGVRKVLGTEKKTLIFQFLVESTLTVIFSLLIALLLAFFVMPVFNELAAKSLSLSRLLESKWLILVLILPFIVGALAGLYPAFFLAKFQPADVLKGNIARGFKKSNLRSALVVFQFTTSIVLIIATIVIYNQLNYIQKKNLGFKKEQVLIINGTGALETQAAVFKEEVLKMPGVTSGTLSAFLPVSSSRTDQTFSTSAVINPGNGINMQRWTVDYDYIRTLGMNMARGRSFSKDFSDSSATIINETTAKLLGMDNPLGHKLYTLDENNRTQAFEIIGVVKNFHFESLRQEIGPLCMMLGNSSYTASFKVSTGNIEGLVSAIGKKWKQMAPGLPFSYQFMDESFDQIYRKEQRVGSIAITFTVLAILIACLGLFGLVTYSANQRVKEISIRKVLGASSTNIVNMLSLDFLKLVFIALVISIPLAWWTMHTWLQDFAYRTDISWWIFFVAAVIALFIAWITVSLQALRAALTSPVKNLRTE